MPKSVLKPVRSPDAPLPNGHYSQAMQAGNIVFLSMQLPMVAGADVDPGAMTPLEQAMQVLKNIEHIVVVAGGAKNDVARLTFYITDRAHWPAVDEACEKFFGEHKPARGIVHVQTLSKGYSVAADSIAAIPVL